MISLCFYLMFTSYYIDYPVISTPLCIFTSTYLCFEGSTSYKLLLLSNTRTNRIHRLLLCKGVRPPPPNKCPGYDTKQSDGEVPAMLELWGMQSTPSLPSLPGPLWPKMIAPDKGPIYGLNRTKPCFFHYTDFCI